ncbi:acyl-CoA dehydrogenase [Noviherbaspirillum suwonense]|uniref:Acyl-CoA dehydrogenase n=1 Tax=Noviherbaspirillum suwonense TaxID=1224511 RepID=A0ABY1QRN5_9BURK|nr:acyl-CoA dehydrogenase [Noviherbaspirillum suwonense]SMP78969.1 Acyl-CoA dehydrogenase [Noviherbaspirillum suwonense]
MFAEAIEQILKLKCTPAAVRAIEAGGAPTALWTAIADAGFLEMLTPEAAGGAGLPLAELYQVLVTLARYGMPVPLAQSIAARALMQGAEAPAGMITLAPALRITSAGMTCPLVPFGALAEHVLAADGEDLLLLPGDCAVRTATGVRGSLVATLAWKTGQETLRLPGQGGAVAVFGAALHAALLAGAMHKVFDMTLAYANDRRQFGKSIGKFQAIQHQISEMAEQVVAASIAAEAAFQSDGNLPALLSSAIAKSRASEAAVPVASIAHAVHGAIGVTEEYDLQLYTRRLHEWRIAHGSEACWNHVIGQAVLASTAPGISDFVRSTVA